jgi:hypothetical protein
MNFDNLKTMTPEQLREVAGRQGLNVHPRAKPETIIKQIMEAVLTPQKLPEMQHKALAPVKPVDHNTPEDVEAAIADIKARVPAFESRYDEAENTWHFRCKGAEECGNMDIPLRVIKMKAQNVSRGRLALVGLTEHFDRTVAGGNSAYTNAVLAG